MCVDLCSEPRVAAETADAVTLGVNRCQPESCNFIVPMWERGRGKKVKTMYYCSISYIFVAL